MFFCSEAKLPPVPRGIQPVSLLRDKANFNLFALMLLIVGPSGFLLFCHVIQKREIDSMYDWAKLLCSNSTHGNLKDAAELTRPWI